MNSEISQIETQWGVFDLPIIKIDECFSKFEDPIMDVNHGGLTDLQSNVLSINQKPRLSDLENKRDVNQISHKIANNTINTKRRWELISKRNSKELSDSDDFEFEQIEKKVKKEAKDIINSMSCLNEEAIQYENSTVYTNSPVPADYDQNKELCSPRMFCSKPKTSSHTQASVEEKKRITSEDSQIIEAFLNQMNEEVMFKVENTLSKNEEAAVVNMTREDILKQDPTILIYFYEKSLQFKKSNYFSAKSLKKL